MSKPVFLIGISGGSGSGKTAFIQYLRQYFSERELALISEDNYYHSIEYQHLDENGVHNFDVPQAIDHEAFLRHLELLKRGQAIRKKEYTFNNKNAVAKEVVIQPAPVIIAEGLFIFHHTDIRNQFDLKVLIDAKDELKIIRRIKRDQIERNYPLDDVLYRYQHHVAPAFTKYIMPYLGEVDIVINNNKGYEKAGCIIRAYIESLLQGGQG